MLKEETLKIEKKQQPHNYKSPYITKDKIKFGKHELNISSQNRRDKNKSQEKEPIRINF